MIVHTKSYELVDCSSNVRKVWVLIDVDVCDVDTGGRLESAKAVPLDKVGVATNTARSLLRGLAGLQGGESASHVLGLWMGVQVDVPSRKNVVVVVRLRVPAGTQLPSTRGQTARDCTANAGSCEWLHQEP